MGWWKAAPSPASSDPSSSQPQTPPASPAARPDLPTPTSSQPDSCPVDPKTRSIWLQQAQAQAKNKTTTSPPSLPTDHPPLPPTTNPATVASKECSSTRITGQSATPPPVPITPTSKTKRPLSQDREISSIPRASTHPSALPANAESETGAHPSGKWIYPSESQFYSAVMAKQTASDPNALLSSISHIIPIHNAVNERAWTLIQTWEGSSSDSCGGPKLASFAGRGAGASTPRAKWNSWVMGKLEPFDRHDWVVERCDGRRVEYVIDFYQGKAMEGGLVGASAGANGKQGGENLNFFLDVRPKLNSVEGARMRFGRYWGFEK